ncbi:MAG: 7,8-didemethyl-8-hydroxy-5-deazariboflavin synthase subunit CofG [Candidatus Heimdallarchaeaceae archaeon]
MKLMNKEDFLNLLFNEKEELVAQAKEKRKYSFGEIITYSRNIFVPVTRQCRNRCGYCSFVSDDVKSWIELPTYTRILSEARKKNCSEVLLTSGEKPEEKYVSAKMFLKERGFTSTIEYVKTFCERALEVFLLPHTNLGVLSLEELRSLKDCNASLGLMLESSSNRLMSTISHKKSIGKSPKLRLETIENAGKLSIPFTSGVLIGIGETWEERVDSLLKLAELHNRYGHIQEIIIQNFNPQKNTPMEYYPPPSTEEFLLSVSLARLIFPKAVSIQIPPNLNESSIISSINHGANDLGGISPISPDFINPNKDWQQENSLANMLEAHDLHFLRRLPVYPSYEKYLNKRMRGIIEEYYADKEIISSYHR